MRIFLLGFMGTGKTHWGTVIAQQKEMAFFDLDNLVEDKEGQTITEIFTQQGEEAFRKIEKETLRSLVDHKHDIIVSTGGGTPCFYDNMEWMNEQGITIFLKASPAFIVRNIAREKAHRPLISRLTDEELLTFAGRKMRERLPFYSRSRYTVNAETVNIESFLEILDKNK